MVELYVHEHFISSYLAFAFHFSFSLADGNSNHSETIHWNQYKVADGQWPSCASQQTDGHAKLRGLGTTLAFDARMNMIDDR